MSSDWNVVVLSVDALGDLRSALGRFAVDTTAVLDAAAREVRETQEYLESRRRYWQGQVAYWEGEVARLEHDLAACHREALFALASDNDGPDCSPIEAALAAAEQELIAAQDALARAQDWCNQMDQAAQDYQVEANSMADMVDRQLDQAATALDDHMTALRRYAGQNVPQGAGIPPPAPGSAGALYAAAERGLVTAATAVAGGAARTVVGGIMGAAGGRGGDAARASNTHTGADGAVVGAETPSAGYRPAGGFAGGTAPGPFSYPDRPIRTPDGREVVIRSHPNGSSWQVRAYTPAGAVAAGARAGIGDAGWANLTLEQGWNDGPVRAKLQHIESVPSYRASGVGRAMLEQVHEIATRAGAVEIYGDAPGDEPTRAWYARHGFTFRNGGRELFKKV